MRPFYRKDLFRDEIVTSNPLEHRIRIESDEVKFETLKMEKGQSIILHSEHYEVGIVILSGVATLQTEDFRAENIGQRKDVFSGKPTAVYIPCDTQFEIKATGYGVLEMALCKVKTAVKAVPYIIEPDQVEVKEQGVLNWKRTSHEILIGEKESRLIIGETYGCPGAWAVYPYKEEESKTIFHFKMSPMQGKKAQVMRDIDNPRAYFVQDDTTILVQSTYIPVPEVEGYEVYNLWFKVAR